MSFTFIGKKDFALMFRILSDQYNKINRWLDERHPGKISQIFFVISHGRVQFIQYNYPVLKIRH